MEEQGSAGRRRSAKSARTSARIANGAATRPARCSKRSQAAPVHRAPALTPAYLRPRTPPVGELAALSAAFLWAASTVLYTRVGARTSPAALNLFKTSVAWLLILLTLHLRGGPLWPELSAPDLGWLAASAILGLTLGDTAFFVALPRLGPGRTLLIWALVPLFTAALAWPLLGEVLPPSAVLGAALTLAGIVWVLRERSPSGALRPAAPLAGVGFALAAVLCQALGSIGAKLGGGSLDPLALTGVRLTFGVLGLLAQVTLQGRLGEVRRLATDRTALGFVLLATLLGTYLGLWLSMAALQLTLVGVAATLTSTTPIFILPLSRIFLKEPLTARSVAGATLAVAGVAVLLLAS